MPAVMSAGTSSYLSVWSRFEWGIRDPLHSRSNKLFNKRILIGEGLTLHLIGQIRINIH